MKATVFIDGEAGTTGLQIRDRLSRRDDLVLATIDPARRKDPALRAERLNGADAVILCLPDAAAREAVALIRNPRVKVIDASSAHRTAPGWVYGFPEMHPAQRDAIAGAMRIANPGCYATGFIALVRPLVDRGLLPPSWPLVSHAVSGYSGGGRPMIAAFEDARDPGHTDAPYLSYANDLAHKHVPEMQVQAGLTVRPLFAPAVGRYRQGMIVEVPLQLAALPAPLTADAAAEAWRAAYAGEAFIEVASPEAMRGAPRLDPRGLNGSDALRLYAFGGADPSQARLVAVLDNLGKGAAGAAVQNLNLALGLEEGAGLVSRHCEVA